ncbi:MAG: shikimate kinase [Candidatus Omnitrophica bacterium]|nr:shikimate kinase [Candidatus Omnitrophota bacterium]
MNIYLTGFMGTGKSVVARQLAQLKQWPPLDLDQLIEQREGKLIVEIFKEKGEPYFRKIEKQILKEVAQQKNQIISCGGGIVLDPENIALMKKTGIMVCLTARIPVILERTRGLGHRPLLLVDNPEEKIRQLLQQRQPFYAQADLSIDTSDITPYEVACQILRKLNL